MTLEHARIIKGSATGAASGVATPTPALARVVPREILAARAEAERIVAEARANAAATLENAAAEARAAEIARLSAVAIQLRNADEQRAERDLERTIALAKLLAERLIGAELSVAPGRIAELAAAALQETRGARRVRIAAHPDDVAPLQRVFAEVGQTAEVHADDALGRGSLLLHTDLGDVDASLGPQLDRLAAVLRDAMRDSP